MEGEAPSSQSPKLDVVHVIRAGQTYWGMVYSEDMLKDLRRRHRGSHLSRNEKGELELKIRLPVFEVPRMNDSGSLR